MRGKRLILNILIIILSIFLVEAIFNFKILILDESEKGTFPLQDSLVSSEGFRAERGKYILEDVTGVLKWKWDGKYVDKFYYDFNTSDLLNSTIKVGVINGYGEEEVKEFIDANPKILSSSIVNIKERISWISMEISHDVENDKTSSQPVISNPRFTNKVLINKYRIVVVLLLGMLISVMIWGRKLITEKIEYGFAVVAFVFGLIMLISIPANKVGWDEETHFYWAYRMSLLPGAEIVSTEIAGQLEVSLYNWPYNQPQSYEEKTDFTAIENEYYTNGDQTRLVEGMTCGVRTPGLIFQAAMIKLARGIGLSFDKIFLAGRFAGLLLYVCLVFGAIRIIPVGKRILTFISLMPTSLFLSICYTYDTAIYGYIVLGVAIILREWLEEEREVEWKSILIAAGCLAWGILPKAIYAPLVLLIFFIPVDKYKSKKQARLLRFLFVFLFVALMISFILPQLFSSSPGDLRGGDVNAPQQMENIFRYPLTYCLVLLKSIFSTLPQYVFGEDCYRLMGHLQTAEFVYLVPIMAVLLILTDTSYKKVIQINIKQRIIIFILLGISVALIWTALYISFTPFGVTQILGVQGRYYRPLLPLLYIIISNKYVCVKITYEKYNVILLGLCFLITGVTVMNVFLSFCL